MLPPDCCPLPEALYHPQLEGCGRVLLGGVRGLSLKTLQHPKQQEMIGASGIRAPISAHQSEFHVSVMGCWCSLQIPNLHFSHPLIRPSWQEGGREAHSGNRKGGLPPAWKSFSALFGGPGALRSSEMK